VGAPAAREIGLALFLAAFGGGVAAYAVASISPGVTTDPLGPAAVPAALGGAIALCGVLLLVAALFPVAPRRSAAGLLDLVAEPEEDPPAPFSPPRLALAIAATAAYVAAFEPLGQPLATPPYVAALLLIHGGVVNRALFVVAPILVTAALFLGFRVGLQVPLPGGPLEALFLR
jgi:hypothetical protein